MITNRDVLFAIEHGRVTETPLNFETPTYANMV